MRTKIKYEISYLDLSEINEELHTTYNELVLEQEPDNTTKLLILLIQVWQETSPDYYQFNGIKVCDMRGY